MDDDPVVVAVTEGAARTASAMTTVTGIKAGANHTQTDY